MSLRQRTAAVAIACACFSCPVLAHADEPAQTRPDNRARAQQLFDSALSDAEAGEFASACPKFLASQEADPKTSTLLNLANCYEKNGQTASAWGAFREAEVLARKAGRTDWEGIARTRADALEPKLVRLSISLPTANRVDGLVVIRDGARIAPGEWGVAIPVDPGEHVVSAAADGHLPWETRVSVTNGSVTVDVPHLEAAAAQPPARPSSSSESPIAPRVVERSPAGWSATRTTGVVLAGAGAGGLIAAGIVGLVAKSTYDDARAQCRDGSRGCPASAVDDADGAHGLATGATVVAVIGTVLLAGGATLFLLAPDGERAASSVSDHRPAHRPADRPARVGVGAKGLRLVW